ncbi:MAG: peptidyl-prolyl cis-trans isomerase [Thermodesulfobacteriota bacterium]
MKKIIALIGILMMFGTGNACAAKTGGGLPMVNGKEVIATLNGDPIYLDEFNKALSSMHGHGQGASAQKAGEINYKAPLKRLVDIRLVLLEAENIGLGDLPDIQDQVAAFSKQSMRKFLLDKATMDLTPDAAMVDPLYKQEVKKYALQSLKISTAEEAQKIVAEIGAGSDYSVVAAKAIADGIAEGTLETKKHSEKEMLPQIGAALAGMKKDSLSPIIPIQDGFVLIKLNDILYPEDPAVKEQVEQRVLNTQKSGAQAEYIIKLQEKYTKIDEDFLKDLDLEAKGPGFATLLEDKRVVASIEGEEPVTVGELATEIKKKFFHGIEKMFGTGKLNKEKKGVLDKILTRRVIAKEAFAQGIDKDKSFQAIVDDFRSSMLFGAVMTKVIIPNLQMGEKDIEQYYQEHLQDFSSPPMVRLKSLVFSKKENAEKALAKLRSGTDLSWLTAHAQGQVEAKSEGLLHFDGSLLMLTTLPGNLQKQLTDVRKGDTTTYADDNGYFYSILVEDVVEPMPQELAEVHETIKEKVFKIKLRQAFDEMTDKLREFYPVKSYVDQLIDMSAVQ